MVDTGISVTRVVVKVLSGVPGAPGGQVRVNAGSFAPGRAVTVKTCPVVAGLGTSLARVRVNKVARTGILFRKCILRARWFSENLGLQRAGL